MKIAALGLLILLVAGAVSTFAHTAGPAPAIPAATLSPYELQLQTNVKTLPAQQIDNLF